MPESNDPLSFSIPQITDTLKGSPTKFFGTVRQKSFDGKLWHNPLKHKLFGYPKLMTHSTVPLRNFLALGDKKFSTGNRDITLVSKNFFDTRNQWHHKGFPYEVFRYCETKQFWQKIVLPAPSLIPNIFRYQKFSETQKGSSTKFFGTVRQKFFNGKSWYHFA